MPACANCTPCLRRAVIAVGAGASSLRLPFGHLGQPGDMWSFSICLLKLLRACFRFAARLHPPEEALEFAATTTTNAFFSRALGKASRAQQPHKTRRLIRLLPPNPRRAASHTNSPPPPGKPAGANGHTRRTASFHTPSGTRRPKGGLRSQWHWVWRVKIKKLDLPGSMRSRICLPQGSSQK